VENKKPEDIKQYLQWLQEAHKMTIDEHYKAYYKSVTSNVKFELEKSKFWRELTDNLNEYAEQYQLECGYVLFSPNLQLEVLTKTFDSFLLKTYRKNVLENQSWPDQPNGGWLLPSNWFGKINDIIRTLLVVKYLDGVNFVKEKISSFCKANDMICDATYEAREEGYYALHLYTKKTFEIRTLEWDAEDAAFSIEIQITTQLQEVIRRLLHKYYEQRRKKLEKSADKWQWDYRSDEFCTNYLGHILHYIEGMIMDIREKQRSDEL